MVQFEGEDHGVRLAGEITAAQRSISQSESTAAQRPIIIMMDVLRPPFLVTSQSGSLCLIRSICAC